MQKKLKVIITGATGMVGEGVLHVCLQHPMIEQVLVITRKPVGIKHPKYSEIIHPDFYDLSAIADQLSGYDACYFCLGISSVGQNKTDYYHITYDLTMHVATTLAARNQDMAFFYVSGAGTDGSAKGRISWARVKGKTENDLQKLPFRDGYAYRPGFIKPIKGLKYYHKVYRFLNWLYPIGKQLAPASFNTLEEVGLSMIRLTLKGDDKKVVDGRDIRRYAAEMKMKT